MSSTYSPNRFARAVPYGLSRATCPGVTVHPSATRSASASLMSTTFCEQAVSDSPASWTLSVTWTGHYTDTSVDVGPASEPAHITGADPTR